MRALFFLLVLPLAAAFEAPQWLDRLLFGPSPEPNFKTPTVPPPPQSTFADHKHWFHTFADLLFASNVTSSVWPAFWTHDALENKQAPKRPRELHIVVHAYDARLDHKQWIGALAGVLLKQNPPLQMSKIRIVRETERVGRAKTRGPTGHVRILLSDNREIYMYPLIHDVPLRVRRLLDLASPGLYALRLPNDAPCRGAGRGGQWLTWHIDKWARIHAEMSSSSTSSAFNRVKSHAEYQMPFTATSYFVYSRAMSDCVKGKTPSRARHTFRTWRGAAQRMTPEAFVRRELARMCSATRAC